MPKEGFKKKLTKEIFVAKNQLITQNYLDKQVLAHNGRQYLSLLISANMIGHKFGEFIKTKRIGSIMHTIGRKSKKKGGLKSGRRK